METKLTKKQVDARKHYQDNKKIYLERNRLWRLNNPEKFEEYRQKWIKNNPKVNKEAHRKWALKTKYKITSEEYESLAFEQHYSCPICNKIAAGEDRHTRLVVDHCHDSSKVRGLLCWNCNIGLGHFKDNPELVERAAVYLRKEGLLAVDQSVGTSRVERDT